MRTQFLNLVSSIQRPGIPELITFLENSDFFRAPASGDFHLNHEGGLVEHSLNVYNALKGIANKYSPQTPEDSIKICGLLHDLCKTNLYVKGKKNKKISGKWHEVDTWDHDDKFPVGHGEKSAMMLLQFISLTEEEMLGIRWHMGPWDAESWGQKRSLNAAMDQCMMVKCVMMADQVATFFMEA